MRLSDVAFEGGGDIYKPSRRGHVSGEDMSELVQWAEDQALENLRFHIQSAEMISKEANTTLTVFLAGVGGASAYTVKLVESHAPIWLMAATITFGLCLLVLAGRLILGCLKIEVIS